MKRNKSENKNILKHDNNATKINEFSPKESKRDYSIDENFYNNKKGLIQANITGNDYNHYDSNSYRFIQNAKLYESEETFYYNNTDFELGNLKISKNSLCAPQRNEENNCNLKNNNPNDKLNNNNNQNYSSVTNSKETNKLNIYVKRLEQKVRDQAARLSDAEIYRYLCEKKIKLLNPQQTFPITEEHLKEIVTQANNYNGPKTTNRETSPDININDNSYLNKSNNNVNQNVKITSQDLLMIEQWISNTFYKDNHINNAYLNNVYHINNNKSFKEADILIRLLIEYKNFVLEKNNLINLLQKEKSAVEELLLKNRKLKKDNEDKNLNMLQVENGFMAKNGFLDTKKSDIDIEFLKCELEHYKKLSESYYNENSQIKILNQELISKKDKIMNTFEEGLKDLENMRYRLKELEKENKELKNENQNVIYDNFNSYRNNKSFTIIPKNDNINNVNFNNNPTKEDQMNMSTFSNNIHNISNTSVVSNVKNTIILKHKREKSMENNTNEYIKKIREMEKYAPEINEYGEYSNNISSENIGFINQKKCNSIKESFHSSLNCDIVCSDLNITNNKMQNNNVLEIQNKNEMNFNKKLYNRTVNQDKCCYADREILINRLNEYKKYYENLNNEFEELIKNKSSLEIENSKLLNEAKIKQEKIIYFEKQILENNDTISQFKAERDNFNKEITILLNKIGEISSTQSKESHLMQSLKEYQRLYEEINLEFEEFKNSNYKKVKFQNTQIKERDKHINKLKEEIKNSKIGLNMKYQTKDDKVDLEGRQRSGNDKLKENELTILRETFEKTKLQNESLNQNIKILESNIQELKKEKNFEKEKYENEINLRLKELDENKTKIETLCKENIKLKENKKDGNKICYANYVNQEIESLNDQINGYIIKEKEYNLASIKIQRLEKENDNLSSINQEARKNRVYLENQISELLQKKDSFEKEIKYLRDNTQFNDEIYTEKSIEIEKLKKIINESKLKMEEYDKRIKIQVKEKEQLQDNLKEIEDAFRRKQDTVEKLYSENLSLNDNLAIYKLNINALFGELKVKISKLNKQANEDLESLFTKDFSTHILKMASMVNSFAIINFEDKNIIEICKEFINLSLSEFDSFYEKLIDSNNFIQDCNSKIIFMQEKLNNRDQELAELVKNETKFQNKIHFLQEDNKNLKEENQVCNNNSSTYLSLMNNNIKSDNNINYHTINNNNIHSYNNILNQKNEILNNYDRKFLTIQEINNIKTSFDDLNSYIDESKNSNGNNPNCAQKNIINHDQTLENLKMLYNELKNEQLILKSQLEKVKKEKNSFIEFLHLFVKNYPCKIVSKLLQDLLNIKEILNRTENEKLKIQEKIDSLAYEYKKLERDESTSKNEDLLKVIKSEKENLKILLSEYNDKISEKKEQEKNIEKEITQNIEKVKEIYNNSKENHDNYKFLYDEINSFRERLENIKIDNNENKNDISNLLKESFAKLTELMPKGNSYLNNNNNLHANNNYNKILLNERTLIKPNFDYSIHHVNKKDEYAIYNTNSVKNDFKIGSTIPSHDSKNLHKQDMSNLKNNKNQLLNNVINKHTNFNQLQEINILTSHFDTTIDFNSQNADILLANHKSTRNANPLNNNDIKNNKLKRPEIDCLESNLFSDLSGENLKIFDNQKADVSKKNTIANIYSSNNNNNDCKRNHIPHTQTARNPIENIKSFANNRNIINNVNNIFRGYKELTENNLNDKDNTKYDSLQYDYSESIDLKKLESTEFANNEIYPTFLLKDKNNINNENKYNNNLRSHLVQIKEERIEYSASDMKHDNYRITINENLCRNNSKNMNFLNKNKEKIEGNQIRHYDSSKNNETKKIEENSIKIINNNDNNYNHSNNNYGNNSTI